MGIPMVTFKCPHCGTVIMQAVGPNWTEIPAPTASGWRVVVLSCPSTACQKAIGSYTYPSE